MKRFLSGLLGIFHRGEVHLGDDRVTGIAIGWLGFHSQAVDRCYRPQPFADERRRYKYLFEM